MPTAGRRSTATCARAACGWPRGDSVEAGAATGPGRHEWRGQFPARPSERAPRRRSASTHSPAAAGNEPLRRARHAASGRRRCARAAPMSRCRSRSSGSPTTFPIATRSSPAPPERTTSPAPHRRWSATSSPTACARATGWRSRSSDPTAAKVSAAGFDLEQEAPRATRAAGKRAPPQRLAAGHLSGRGARAPRRAQLRPHGGVHASLSRAGRRSAPAARPPPAPPRRHRRESPAPAPRTGSWRSAAAGS